MALAPRANWATSFVSATPGAPRKWLSSTPTSTLSELLPRTPKQIQDRSPVAIRFQLRKLRDHLGDPVLHRRGRRRHSWREARFCHRGGDFAKLCRAPASVLEHTAGHVGAALFPIGAGEAA